MPQAEKQEAGHTPGVVVNRYFAATRQATGDPMRHLRLCDGPRDRQAGSRMSAPTRVSSEVRREERRALRDAMREENASRLPPRRHRHNLKASP
jgi:hypothetical protein